MVAEPGLRYGVYLRPSFAMCRAQAEIHDLLTRQYGLRVAGTFMPHATIKGFFRSDQSPAELVARLDPVLIGRPPFVVHNGGVVPYATLAIVLTIQRAPDGSINAPLQALHEAVFEAVAPAVHPECAFTAGEWHGPRFEAHLTLAMSDIPGFAFTEILRFVQDAEPIGPPSFLAETVQLFAFESDDWSDRWWETMRWTLLHSWTLA